MFVFIPGSIRPFRFGRVGKFPTEIFIPVVIFIIYRYVHGAQTSCWGPGIYKAKVHNIINLNEILSRLIICLT